MGKENLLEVNKISSNLLFHINEIILEKMEDKSFFEKKDLDDIYHFLLFKRFNNNEVEENFKRMYIDYYSEEELLKEETFFNEIVNKVTNKSQ